MDTQRTSPYISLQWLRACDLDLYAFFGIILTSNVLYTIPLNEVKFIKFLAWGLNESAI